MKICPSTSNIQNCSNFEGDLLWIAERHAVALAEVEAIKVNCINGNNPSDTLTRAIANEAELRMALMRWQPSSIHEAQTKFLYLIHVLAKTRSSFDTATMSELKKSIAHLLS